jgi:hypothetical protein
VKERAVTKNQKLSVDSANSIDAVSRFALFGPPPLLAGEDSAAYDDLLARVSGSVKPADIIEELWVHDIVDATWDILRWRRIKISLVEMEMPSALEAMLEPLMPYRPLKFEENLSWSESYAPEPPSREYKLAKKWASGDQTAIDRVNKLLSSANVTMAMVMANAFETNFDHIERIDHLITIAEGRRNAVFREIDRHRSAFAHALRDRVQVVDEAEFKVIESKTVTSKNEPDSNAA